MTHYIINDTGQCQESGRDQQHTQLGLAHLADCCEIAWHQGLDLYGRAGNLLLKGFEYTARYNLGEDVPFTETLDRTGKYHHSHISTDGRGRLRAEFEQVYNHYANRVGIPAPYTQHAAERIRPEGAAPGADNVGFGTLLFTRASLASLSPSDGERAGVRGSSKPHGYGLDQSKQTQRAPMSTAGLVAIDSPNEIKLTWVASIGAKGYMVKRAPASGDFRVIAENVSSAAYTDDSVKPGEMYRYAVSATNSSGSSEDSYPTSICAGLPAPWSHGDIGNPAVPGSANFDGNQFTIEGAGQDIGGTNDQCHCAFQPLEGDGVIVARFVPQTSSQFSKFGLMMRSALSADAAQISFLPGPEPGAEIEEPLWNIRLLSRDSAGANTKVRSAGDLYTPAVTFGRLTGFCWLKLERSRDTFTASSSFDGKSWTKVGTATVPLGQKIFVGLAVCSGLDTVETRLTFDNVSVSTAKTPAR